ncbi:N-acyl-D-amino-acid deacylase family protein [Paeniglutamicibacter sp.]|uniref:N-acyl-D-amino-acid deacylase family protein n=1 Tax=Paeniglutamicibacter sp. TaxID=1934391 RepID=UPI003989486C
MRIDAVRPIPVRTAITRTRIIDGTGGAEYAADIVLEEGLIARILPAGSFADDGATRVIDGSGLVTCPGFIDIQGRSGPALPVDPARLAALTQGVTTEALVQCGSSRRTVGQDLDLLDVGQGTNVAYLVAQGTVRAMAMGSAEGAPTAEQLVAQVTAVADALEQGAVGLSSGPEHAPGAHIPAAELEALCTVVAAYGGYWSPILDPNNGSVLDAVAGSIALAAKTGVSLHLAQLSLGTGDEQGKVAELLALLDSALDSGVNLSCDSHPYLESPALLSSLLPAWARDGPATDVLARLNDADAVARIRAELETDGSIDWDAVRIASVGSEQLAMLVGQDIAGIAAIQSTDAITTFVRILGADSLATSILRRTGNEENLRSIMGHRSHIGAGVGFPDAAAHPGTWGAFPRLVGHYVRDTELMDLPAMIHQLTGRPAARLSLASRGVLAAGNAADVLVFDPDAIIDMATLADPRQPAAGIKHVFVNGVAAVSGHLPTSALAGRALRRSAEGRTQHS